MIVGKFSNTLLFFCSFIDVVFACAASHVCTHCVWYSCCACGAQLRIEADQPLTFSDQHSPRLSALAQAIMETLFWFLGCDKIMTGGCHGDDASDDSDTLTRFSSIQCCNCVSHHLYSVFCFVFLFRACVITYLCMSPVKTTIYVCAHVMNGMLTYM